MDGGCWFENVSFLEHFQLDGRLSYKSSPLVPINFRWVDSIGNVHGRADGMNPSSRALLIGSHLVAFLLFLFLLFIYDKHCSTFYTGS